MNYPRTHFVILVLSCLAGWATTAAAQEPGEKIVETEILPLYAVELIVFRRHELPLSYPEDFSPRKVPPSDFFLEGTETEIDVSTLPDDFAMPDEDNAAESLVLEYELIPEELLALTGIFERLTELDRYEPLLHSGWVQAGYEDELGLPFEIAVVSEDDTFLSGAVTLKRSRFLHLDVDLTLEQTGAISYRMHETRKIPPPYVTHYFDHPVMSVIARVTHFKAIEQPPLEPDLPDTLSNTP